MSWWALVPPAAVIAALFFVPGWVLLRAAGVRGLLALGGAPAVSGAYLGLAGFALDRAGVPWGFAPLAVGLVPLALLAAACGWWVRRSAAARGRAPGGLWTGRYALGRRRTVLLTVALAAGALAIGVPLFVGLGGPGAIVQQWDAVYHASGVQLVRETGNASLLGAMQGQYGAAPAGVYYPVVWHGVVALAPGAVALAANASLAVIGAGVWLVGLAALGRVVGDRVWSIAPWTVVLGAAFGLFPHRVVIELGYWPLAAAIAMIPGTVALAVAAGRTDPGAVEGNQGDVGLATPARGTVSVLVVATAALGVGLTHGSAAFSLLLVLVPLALARLGHGLRQWWRAGRRRAAGGVLVTLGVVATAGLAVVLTSPTVRNMADYTYDTHDFFLVTVYRTLFDLPTAPVVPGLWPLAVLAVVGAVVVVRRAEHARARWLVWSAAAVLFVAIASAGGAGPLRALAGFWYSQTARIVAVYPVVAAPLAAFGLLAVAAWVHGRWPAFGRAGSRLLGRAGGARTGHGAVDAGLAGVGRAGAVRTGPSARTVVAGAVVVACLATLGWYAPQKAARTAAFVAPGPVMWGTMLSVEEIALLERMEQITPSDAVILGDPANGAAFAFSVAQRHVVFPQLGPSNQSEAQRTLRFGFHQLTTEPAICDAVRELGVTHFYQDTATTADGAKVSEDWPGLTTPVTPEMLEGLEVVDVGGTATLYRVTACDGDS